MSSLPSPLSPRLILHARCLFALIAKCACSRASLMMFNLRDLKVLRWFHHDLLYLHAFLIVGSVQSFHADHGLLLVECSRFLDRFLEGFRSTVLELLLDCLQGWLFG